MTIHRRGAIAVLACSFALLARPAWSQSGYPTKPVRIIVPFPPGQAADTFSRMLAERLTALWGQQVVVENRGGGGGVPGVMAVKDAPPDGYTWLVGTSGTLGVNPSVYAKIPYDPLKDFAPASNIFIVPLIIVAHPSFAPNTVAELVEAAKKARAGSTSPRPVRGLRST
jgi:tripartite-type tricarboxylate transporter receptor subunit TctC